MSEMMLDRFGKAVREIRLARGLLLFDMAKTLDISSAELSGIETGRKDIPDWFIPTLKKVYDIDDQYARDLYVLAKERTESYEITYRSKIPLTPGECLSCPLHFINLKPNPGEPSTGCELSGDFIPDEWDLESKPWDKCPIIRCKKERTEPMM